MAAHGRPRDASHSGGEASADGRETMEAPMDAISVGLLILVGLNGVVWRCVWLQSPRRWHWIPWLREGLWRLLVGRPSVATPLVARVHRWAQHQTLSVDVD